MSLQKKKQLPVAGLFMFNPERSKNAKNTYRQNLIKQSLEMNEEKEEDEQDKDLPSPNFGMLRTFTFADLSKK